MSTWPMFYKEILDQHGVRYSRKMIYRREKKKRGFYRFLSLKNGIVLFIVTIVGGIVLLKYFGQQERLEKMENVEDSQASTSASTHSRWADIETVNHPEIIRPSQKKLFFSDPGKLYFIDLKLGIRNEHNRCPFEIIEYSATEIVRSRLKYSDVWISELIENDSNPKFTEDAKGLVVCRKYPGLVDYSLYLLGIEESSLKIVRRLAQADSCEYSLTHDGKSVVYTARVPGRNDRNVIKRIDLDGTNETELVPSTQATVYSNPIVKQFDLVIRVIFKTLTGIYYVDVNPNNPNLVPRFVHIDIGINFFQHVKLAQPSFGPYSLSFAVTNNNQHIWFCMYDFKDRDNDIDIKTHNGKFISNVFLSKDLNTYYYHHLSLSGRIIKCTQTDRGETEILNDADILSLWN